MQTQQQGYGVIVIGSGIAGLSAAVAALEGGAKVCLVERATADEAGGNTRHTGAYIRMKSTSEVSDDFEEHFAANAGGYLDPLMMADVAREPENWPPLLKALSFVDPNVVSTLAEQAPDTLAWLGKYGVTFFPLAVPFPTSAQPRIVPSGGGLAMVEALTKSFREMGGTILYETVATSLVQDDDGAVCGLNVLGRGNRKQQLRAPAVVIASGGFQGNAEMLTRYIGPRALNLRTMSVGCHYNKGEGIRMALDIGAAPCGDFGSYHASPMDPRSNRAGPSMYIYPYGILVNKEGQRFVDEGPGETDETYERVTRRIFAQTDGIAWCILDAKVSDVPNQAVAIRTEQPAIEAATLAQLAVKIDISAEMLERSVAEYNAACVQGAFDPRRVDGLATRGLNPPKSNWARPVDQGPYKAYPIISSIVFTFGGLKTDTTARVVNQQGDAIPGLYAAGEVQGLYYGNYTGATSVLKGAVFGRIAGRDAARVAAARKPAPAMA
jgi:tricarballylate dehydrogenase